MRVGLPGLLLLLAVGSAFACASAPPPAPPEPAAPAPPMDKDSYLSGWLTAEVQEVFVGTATLQPGLQWLVLGVFHNQGNRDVEWIEVEFHIATTGKRYRHIVVDPVQGIDPVPAGEQAHFNVPVCGLPDGVAGDYDPNRSDYPPPEVTAKVVDLRFSGSDP